MKSKIIPPKVHSVSVIEPAIVVCLGLLICLTAILAPAGCQQKAGQLLPHAPPGYRVPDSRFYYEECPVPVESKREKYA